MEKSEIKTADYNSGGYFKVSVVKISARSDEVRGGFYAAQFDILYEKPVLRKTRNKFDQYIFSPTKVGSLVSDDFMDSFSWGI
jgi:hypothetical protein